MHVSASAARSSCACLSAGRGFLEAVVAALRPSPSTVSRVDKPMPI